MSQAPDRAARISVSYPPTPATRARASEHFFILLRCSGTLINLEDSIENCDLLSDAASNSTDGSHMLFSMYNEKAMEADRTLIDNWAKDADSIMLLGGLISATVSTFLSQATSTTLLKDASLTVVVLNSVTTCFWFMSLGSSLTTVVVANLVQGWVRRYSAMTQRQRSSDNCARIRAYVLHQRPLDSFQLTMDSMRLLLDISIFSFLIGLCILTGFATALSSLAVLIGVFPLVLLYFRSTTNSLRHSYSVFPTPMSNVLVALPRRFKRLSALWAMVRRRQVHDPDHVVSHNWLMLDQAARLTERLVKSDSLSLDREIVETILKSLNQGHELERFLASIPSFYHSAQVQEPAQVFRPFSNILSNGIVSFIDHTLSSQTLPNETKQDRIKL
ncbi:hypothetical protein BC826DRAFT_1177659, partial [Russula brevipes]